MIQDRQNNIRQFEEHEEYDEFSGSTEFTKPNVSHCVEEEHVHYNPGGIHIEDDAIVSFSGNGVEYNGEPQHISDIVVVVQGKTLVEGVDFIVVGDSSATDAGVYTFTIVGIGEYEGSKTCTFTIKAKTITPTVTLSPSTYDYDGTAKKPTVTVKDGSNVIDPSEYNVSYSNNVNAGTAKATITDKAGGNYVINSVSKNFTIKKALKTEVIWVEKPLYVHVGETVTVSATSKYYTSDKPLYQANTSNVKIGVYDGKITGIHAGTATISVSFKGNSNFYNTTERYSLTILDAVSVDLDLPSGTLWAKYNLGVWSGKESDYGSYYQYGQGAKTVQESSGLTIYTGTERPLDVSVDAARQTWWGNWVIPTPQDWRELMENTKSAKVQIDGIGGIKYMSKKDASKYIFLPAGGFYEGNSQAIRLNEVGKHGFFLTSFGDDYDSCVIHYFNYAYQEVWPSVVWRGEAFNIRPIKRS